MYKTPSDFGHVYEEHAWRVYAFLAYRLNDRHTAEDLTHVTFERALRAWPRFDQRRASANTWLMMIARNVLIDDQRRIRPEPVETISETLLPAQPGPDEHGATSPELIAALAELPARDRDAIALRFGADMQAQEIASLLDLSSANVHQILSRALRKLRGVLAKGARGPSRRRVLRARGERSDRDRHQPRQQKRRSRQPRPPDGRSLARRARHDRLLADRNLRHRGGPTPLPAGLLGPVSVGSRRAGQRESGYTAPLAMSAPTAISRVPATA